MVLIDALAEPAKLTKASGVVARSLEAERRAQRRSPPVKPWENAEQKLGFNTRKNEIYPRKMKIKDGKVASFRRQKLRNDRLKWFLTPMKHWKIMI